MPSNLKLAESVNSKVSELSYRTVICHQQICRVIVQSPVSSKVSELSYLQSSASNKFAKLSYSHLSAANLPSCRTVTCQQQICRVIVQSPVSSKFTELSYSHLSATKFPSKAIYSHLPPTNLPGYRTVTCQQQICRVIVQSPVSSKFTAYLLTYVCSTFADFWLLTDDCHKRLSKLYCFSDLNSLSYILCHINLTEHTLSKC